MARGGSRFGAGRPAYKAKAELSLSLDIRELKRQGYLNCFTPFSWHWTTNHDDHVGSATIHVRGDMLSLSYTISGRYIENLLQINAMPCYFGGERLWFACPQCRDRCARVFLNRRNGKYACRKCVGITYYSQSEDAMDRAWRKQNKLERKLDKYWMKPKGMHQRTHTKLVNKIFACEKVRDDYLCMMYLKMKIADTYN